MLPMIEPGPEIWIITFSKDSTVYTIDSPIKVVNANCFHKFTAGAMKQHLLIDLRDTSLFLELSLFPKIIKHSNTKTQKNIPVSGIS